MDPERISRWWGPHGTTARVVEMDVRVGGAWRYVSTGPNRDDVEFYGTYLGSSRQSSSRGRSCSMSKGWAMGGPERSPSRTSAHDKGDHQVTLHFDRRDRRRSRERHDRRRRGDLGPPRGDARRRLNLGSGAGHPRGWVPGFVIRIPFSRARTAGAQCGGQAVGRSGTGRCGSSARDRPCAGSSAVAPAGATG